MAIGKKQIYSFQVAAYLMKHYGYEVIRVRSGQNPEEEIWLMQENGIFPLVRITPFAAQSDRFELERLLMTREKVFEALELDGGKLLCIHINEEQPTQYHKDILEYCLEKDFASSDELDNVFPGIRSLLKEIKNPLLEYRTVLKEIHEVNNANHQNSKPTLKNLPLSYSIIILCTAVFVLALLAGKKFSDNVLGGILMGAYYKTLVLGNHEFHRLITYGFVHTEFFHLFMNMYALYSIGPAMERVYGKKKFLLALLVSIFVGGLAVMAGSYNEVSLGLSGGLYGLLAMLLVYAIETGAIRNPRIARTFMSVLIINILISFMPSVSLLGHFGGFIAGALLGIIFSKKESWKSLRTNSMVALVLLIGVIGFLIVRDPKYGTMYLGTDYGYVNALRQLDLRFLARIAESNLLKYYQIVGG